MFIVAVYGWQKDESEVARVIADAQGSLVYDARQKISGGGPAVLANYADSPPAEALAAKLSQNGVPAMVIACEKVRRLPVFNVHRFQLAETGLKIESFSGESREIRYCEIRLILIASCAIGNPQETAIETKRKFSLGRTLLAGGVPMTKTIKTEKNLNTEERDESMRLYVEGQETIVVHRSNVNFSGLGDAMKLTRELNFNCLKSELRRLASSAHYDERLLKRSTLTRILGPTLDPAKNTDLACEILAKSLLLSRSE